MSINDEIGDYSGGQSHLWRGERRDAIVENFVFDFTRSATELDRDVSGLIPEVRGAEIARNTLTNTYLDLGSDTFKLACGRARRILEVTFSEDHKVPKSIGYFGGADDIAPAVAELAYLSYAFDAGVTQGDLLAWGVDPFVIIQLVWWQRRDGETLLNQQIRAIRNGWALPWLAAAVRDLYRNLARMIDRGEPPKGWFEEFAEEIVQIREVLEFFDSDGVTEDENATVPRDLTQELTSAWARAFAAREVPEILPDIRGRWAQLPIAALGRGELREPLLTVVRYLDQQGYKPEDWGSTLTQEFFGRVGDQ